MASEKAMEELIAYLAKQLVDEPDAVQVTTVAGDPGEGPIIELRVAQNDLGKVIGRQGRTAKALRTLLSAACTKARTRATLEILD
jgi:predicted RNA-binding protein YlqC (UPF0109 family)